MQVGMQAAGQNRFAQKLNRWSKGCLTSRVLRAGKLQPEGSPPLSWLVDRPSSCSFLKPPFQLGREPVRLLLPRTWDTGVRSAVRSQKVVQVRVWPGLGVEHIDIDSTGRLGVLQRVRDAEEQGRIAAASQCGSRVCTASVSCCMLGRSWVCKIAPLRHAENAAPLP